MYTIVKCNKCNTIYKIKSCTFNDEEIYYLDKDNYYVKINSSIKLCFICFECGNIVFY